MAKNFERAVEKLVYLLSADSSNELIATGFYVGSSLFYQGAGVDRVISQKVEQLVLWDDRLSSPLNEERCGTMRSNA
jgi:hypothetical protein